MQQPAGKVARQRWTLGLVRRPVVKDVYHWVILASAAAFFISYTSDPEYTEGRALPAIIANALASAALLWLMFMAPRRLVVAIIDAVRDRARPRSHGQQEISAERGSSSPPLPRSHQHPTSDPPRIFMTQPARPVHRTNVMIVYGRNEEARNALADYLRTLALAPLQWHTLVASLKQGSPYVGDIVKRAFDQAQAVVILMTPDERVHLRPDLGDEPAAMQPRPNVLLEAGMALMAHPNRTIIVHLGDIRSISDLEGRHVIRLGDGSDARPLVDLASRLENAGCPVRREGTDWLDTTRFRRVPGLR